MTVVEREQSTPTGFSIDLVVHDENGDEGIIECQLRETDHDHLGKVLAYLTSLEADFAVWIVREARYEHRQAIEWLNESTDKSFYLVGIEIVEIDGRKGPLFTPITGPTPTARAVGETKRELDDREQKYREFWDGLLTKSNDRFSLFSSVSAGKSQWLGTGAGIAGVSYAYRLTNTRAEVELYIQTEEKQRNKEIFDSLEAHRDEIEAEFGSSLNWERKDKKRHSKIGKVVAESGLRHEEEWEEVQEQMVDAMERLYDALNNHVSALNA